MKRIAIKIAGSERDPIDRNIKPGTTAGEILADIGLEGYLLSTGPNSTRFFAEEENVYSLVSDGDKLYATTPAEVGDSGGRAPKSVPFSNGVRLTDHLGFLKSLLTIKRRITVKRSATSYLKQQDWKFTNGRVPPRWEGYYRTRFGSFRGNVETLSCPRFYIHKPPEVLRQSGYPLHASDP
ncbi:MAG: hypothetical protein ACREA4_00105 [Nitrososphaera sp.]